MSQRRRADSYVMVRIRRSLEEELTLCIRHLPPSLAATPIGPAWVVVGPTGVFVVLAHDGSNERARALGRLAATIRSAFAEQMTWVPFVHALLVDNQPHSIAQATVVPPANLTQVLTEGRQTLEVETIESILRLIADGVLDGLEAVGPAPVVLRPSEPDGRLPSCSDSPAATTSPSPSTNSDRTPRDPQFSSPMPPVSTVGSGHRSPPS